VAARPEVDRPPVQGEGDVDEVGHGGSALRMNEPCRGFKPLDAGAWAPLLWGDARRNHRRMSLLRRARGPGREYERGRAELLRGLSRLLQADGGVRALAARRDPEHQRQRRLICAIGSWTRSRRKASPTFSTRRTPATASCETRHEKTGRRASPRSAWPSPPTRWAWSVVS